MLRREDIVRIIKSYNITSEELPTELWFILAYL